MKIKQLRTVALIFNGVNQIVQDQIFDCQVNSLAFYLVLMTMDPKLAVSLFADMETDMTVELFANMPADPAAVILYNAETYGTTSDKN
ncbi:MAG: hypothetical protein AAFZ92_10085, partial [Pseudomonadota bacterium]